MPSERSEQLNSILKLLGTSVTKTEVQDAFKYIVKYVQDIKKSNEQEWTLIHSAMSLLEERVRNEMVGNPHIASIKQQALEHTQQALQMQQNGMKAISARVAALRNGKNGRAPTREELLAIITPLIPQKAKDGKNAEVDVDAIVAQVLKKIPSGTGRALFGAPPLRLLNSSGTAIEKVARHIKFGTNLTATRSADGVVTVDASASGSTVYSETPTGLVDGANTSYTTLHAITTVLALAINGQFIHPSEYTVSGSGFTMGTALPAGLSGTGFTISYA